MTLSGQEIQRNLMLFRGRWRDYTGSERAEAQTFVNELFACYGTDRVAAGVRFEENQPRPDGGHGFLDALWPGTCLIEMKRPSEAPRLGEHRHQALGYWAHSADQESDVPAVDYVVLCAFGAFEVWQPGRFPLRPRAAFTLEELPDRYDTLLFLAGRDPLFVQGNRRLTTQAVGSTVALYRALLKRGPEAPEVLQSFVLQLVWCLFASSLGVLQGQPVQRIARSLLRDQEGWRSSAAELGHLFTLLADEEQHGRGGIYADTVYANGGCSSPPPTSIWCAKSWSCWSRSPATTGARSPRRSSAHCSRGSCREIGRSRPGTRGRSSASTTRTSRTS